MADRKERQPRQWTLAAAAVLVGLLVVGAVYVAVSGPDDDTTGTATTTQDPPLPSSRSTGGGGCEVTDTSQRVPTTTPADLDWSLWRGMALPSSRSAGPLEIDPDTGITDCYAHTPLGAVMAATNISFRYWLDAPDTTVLDEQVADGPRKGKLRELVAGMTASDQKPPLAGFRVVDYTRSQATIEIAIGRAETGYLTSPTVVTWQDGGWQMVATTNDLDTETGWQYITSMDGYVAFERAG